MEFVKTDLEGLYIIKPKLIEDERGLFTRTYCKNELLAVGLNTDFVQFNHSFNKKRGTIRGMHYQMPPYSETKLIRCVQGMVIDVAVDIRRNSPTFLKSVAVELSAENMLSILIPKGFAHGFQTLEDNTSLIYHHTEFFQADASAGLRPDDPELSISWPLPFVNISEKDKNQKLLNHNFKGI
jgi:dTDP-4-dehydrorhamnose 3,5-epimerase